jgi:hypothetical protein
MEQTAYVPAGDREIKILESFEYHKPTDEQVERIAAVRRAYISCAQAVMQLSRPTADQTAGLRQLHESMMTTLKNIVLEG